MTVDLVLRDQVRHRAAYACEYCGTSETEAGAELTIDHFHPASKGGADSFDNLVYCCSRCNAYKLDYWPASAADPAIWNPRAEPGTRHWIETDDAVLRPLTETGDWTIRRLRLNRPALIALTPVFILHHSSFILALCVFVSLRPCVKGKLP